MDPSIGIKKEERAKVANFLNTLLADEYVLYTKTRNAHWNVEGPDFHAMHLFFEGLYEQLDEIIDDVAERIRTLGHYAPSSLNEFLKLTHLAEDSLKSNGSEDYIKELLSDHESIVMEIRGEVGRLADKLHDAGTSDFITNLIEKHEKTAWMLRAHLK